MGNFSPQSGSGACASFPFLSSTDYPIRRCTILFVLRQHGFSPLNSDTPEIAYSGYPPIQRKEAIARTVNNGSVLQYGF